MLFSILARGDWSEAALVTRWTAGARRIVPEVEAKIEQAWSAASARLGGKLFDGPMCRLEAWEAAPAARLRLSLSPTSYKPFLGTNLSNATCLVERYGADVLANPVGLSTALQSADGWLLLGRRNDSVAYYPNRVHPFAGALEPAPDGAVPNVFHEIRRELREELALDHADLASLRCMGLVEDGSLRQPELIFHAIARRTRAELEATLVREEHCAVHAIPAESRAVGAAMQDAALTPVAAACLALWSRLPAD